jgi:hypothetical protein
MTNSSSHHLAQKDPVLADIIAKMPMPRKASAWQGQRSLGTLYLLGWKAFKRRV